MKPTRPLALLVNLSTLLACPGGSPPTPPPTPTPAPTPTPTGPTEDVSDADWAAWTASLPPAPGSSLPPQYDPGTILLRDGGASPPSDLGRVYVWLNTGGTSYTEGYEVGSLAAYRDATRVTVRELFDSAQRPDGTSLNIAQFDALMSGTPCTATGTDCLARRVYAWAAFPSSAPSQPPGLREVWKLSLQVDSDCPTGVDAGGTAGFLYRTRALVNGRARWAEHWFVRTSGGGGYLPYEPPDHCQAPNSSDTERTVDISDKAADGPSISAFVDQLKGTGCNGEPWCGACGSSGGDCKHTVVELAWVVRI